MSIDITAPVRDLISRFGVTINMTEIQRIEITADTTNIEFTLWNDGERDMHTTKVTRFPTTTSGTLKAKVTA